MRNNGDLLDAFVDMVVASRAQRIIGTYYSSYSFWIYARPGAAEHILPPGTKLTPLTLSPLLTHASR